MNIFFDTSSLFKLYHKESDTREIIALLSDRKVDKIFLSAIARIGFSSIVWRKFREKEFSEFETTETINLFESDFRKYRFVAVESIIMAQARSLIDKYGRQGLRTLDSIQLATAVSLIDECQLFVTSDKLLHSFFQQEHLPVA